MIVRESLNFERGQDPKRSMSIGRVAQANIVESLILYNPGLAIKEYLKL